MYCPDCQNEIMIEDSDFDDVADIIEIIFRFPGCGATFQGTLYRAPEL